MSAVDRIALERSLRSGEAPGILRDRALHNVRLHVGSRELYGRDDWIALELRRQRDWGARPVQIGAQLVAALGGAAHMIAAHWILGEGTGAVPVASFSIVRAGRIVREWQYYDALALTCRAPELAPPVPRVDVAMDYGETRASPGQLNVPADASGVAPRDIAAHPIVRQWHRVWNVERRWPIDALPHLTEPVMFCERLLLSGADAALQWRLSGRATPAGMDSGTRRVEIPGLTFFEVRGAEARARSHHPSLGSD